MHHRVFSKIFSPHLCHLACAQVRYRWKLNDVAIWDNRATQHYALNDYGNQHRVVRRVTVSGDVPVGVDGRRSADLTAAAPQ